MKAKSPFCSRTRVTEMSRAEAILRSLAAFVLVLGTVSCGSNRVHVGQGTEIKEEEANSAAKQAETTEGHTPRETESYPFLTVDLDKPESPPEPPPPE